MGRTACQLRDFAAWAAVAALGPGLPGCSACGDEDRGAGGGIATGDVGRIQITPGASTLPGVHVGGETFGLFEVSNIGGEVLNLAGVRIDSASDEFEVSALTVTALPPGEATELRVTYRPTDPQADEAWLVVDSDALNRSEGKAHIQTQITTGRLVAIPPELDFEDVAPGAHKVLTTDVLNTGGTPVEIPFVGLTDDTSGDFRIEDIGITEVLEPDEADFGPVAGAIRLAAFARLRIRVQYRPVGGDDDFGAVLLRTTQEGMETFSVPLAGSEPSSAIVVNPPVLDFGPTPAGGATRTFKIQSVGNAPLTIADVGQAFPPHDAFTLGDVPDPGLVLGAGFDHEVSVTFVPPISDEEQFTLVFVESDDPANPRAVVEVLGRLDAPVISVLPDLIQFGAPAMGHTVSREVTVGNVGTQDLDVTAVGMAVGQSHADFTLPPPADLDLPWTLAPGERRVFDVRFTPSAGDGQREGLVVVESSDPFRPAEDVIVRGLNGGAPRCDVIAAENQKNYGLVGYGREKVLPVRFIGAGTVDCEVVRVELLASLQGFPPDPAFRITGGLRAGDDIPSQAEATIDVGFRPEAGGFNPFGFLPKSVDLLLTFRGPNAAGGPEERTVRVKLQGTGGDSEIAVLPPELDFGLVTLGCLSQVQVVTVYNTGIAEYSLSNVELRGRDCAPEFTIVDRPELPAVVVPARPAVVEIRYGPQDLGVDTCELVLTSDAGNVDELVVPLRGEGTRFADATDEFVQSSGQEVDVLFIVDNSGSMSDEQDNLADNMHRFIEAAEIWDNDFQLGVVTTDVAGEALFGGAEANRDRGKLVGNPRIVRPADPRRTFERNVLVGDSGGGVESGLEAARLALSPERLHEQPRGNGCGDCVDGEECVANQCVGYNRGFLRDDAALELVFMSDEEDQSPARVDFYIDFFKSLKGFRNGGLLHASAIVGDRGNGCQSNFGAADAGERYIDVADATQGTFHSICVQDFGPALQAIGNRAFGLRVQFFLSRVPDPDTIEVSVAGQPVDAGWEYDEDSNSVVFDDRAVPQPGEHVEIHYTAFCFR